MDLPQLTTDDLLAMIQDFNVTQRRLQKLILSQAEEIKALKPQDPSDDIQPLSKK